MTIKAKPRYPATTQENIDAVMEVLSEDKFMTPAQIRAKLGKDFSVDAVYHGAKELFVRGLAIRQKGAAFNSHVQYKLSQKGARALAALKSQAAAAPAVTAAAATTTTRDVQARADRAIALADGLQKRVDELNAQLAHKQQELETARNEAGSQVCQLTDEVSALQDEAKANKARIFQLEEEKRRIEADYAALAGELAQAKQDLAKARADSDDLTKEAVEALQESSQLKAVNSALEGKIESLQAQLAMANKSLDAIIAGRQAPAAPAPVQAIPDTARNGHVPANGSLAQAGGEEIPF